MSEVRYVKQLIVGGEGKFTITRLEAETEAEVNSKRDIYLADDWQDATEAEYLAESAERDARQGTVDGADAAVGEATSETTTE